MSEGVSETSARRKIADLEPEAGCLVLEMVLTRIDFLPNQCYSYINQMVNIRVVIYIKITYANSKVEKYFSDYRRMQKTLPAEWVRTIMKHIDWLIMSECQTDYRT